MGGGVTARPQSAQVRSGWPTLSERLMLTQRPAGVIDWRPVLLRRLTRVRRVGAGAPTLLPSRVGRPSLPPPPLRSC